MVAYGRLQLGLSQQVVPYRNELGVASSLAGIALGPTLGLSWRGLALAAGRGLTAWLCGWLSLSPFLLSASLFSHGREFFLCLGQLCLN